MTLHVLLGIGIIGLVLVQHGKGADMGTAFGSGSSGSLFGASGSANFLSRTTAVLAALFFMTSLGLSHLVTSRSKINNSVMYNTNASSSKPATPATTQTTTSTMPAGVMDSKASSKAKEIPK